MTVVGIVFILALVAFLVAWPLVRTEKPDYRKMLLEESEDLLEKDKEAVFTTINEIEFDYRMNKLSDDDYEILKSQYKQKALEILQEEEAETLDLAAESSAGIKQQARAEAEIEDEIEEELRALRKKSASSEG